MDKIKKIFTALKGEPRILLLVVTWALGVVTITLDDGEGLIPLIAISAITMLVMLYLILDVILRIYEKLSDILIIATEEDEDIEVSVIDETIED